MVPELMSLLTRHCPNEGVHASPVPGVSCIRFSEPYAWSKRHWRACICIVAQGRKEIQLAGRVYKRQGPHYLVSPLDLPVTSRVSHVSPERPLLSLKLDFDSSAVRDIAKQLERSRLRELTGPAQGVYVGELSPELLEASVRLARLFSRPRDAPVLGPLLVRELLFHVLDGPDGAAIRQFVRPGSPTSRVAEAVVALQTALDADLDVDALARRAGMSRAGFFKRFKDATSMSPLQYQKRLRLLEARRLMLEEGEGAESSARRVGYGSASQFSREYARMFGRPPRRDTRLLRARDTLAPGL